MHLKHHHYHHHLQSHKKNGKKEREKEIIKLTSRVLLSLDDGKKGDRKYVIKFN